MLQKFRDLIETIKSSFIVIVAPLAFLAGYIYILITQNHTLESELEEAKQDAKLQKQKDAVTIADEHATSATESYESIRAKYLAEHPDEH